MNKSHYRSIAPTWILIKNKNLEKTDSQASLLLCDDYLIEEITSMAKYDSLAKI